jgi:catechol 2,3-dioxygenase-like lactoylglutathione lyase family enzyme
MMRLGVTGIHHLRLAVGDLERSQLAWTRLGFALAPRGTYLGGDASDDAILCAQGAVRLFGPRAATAGEESAVVWAVADMSAAEAAVRELGLPFATPREVVRQSELPEASVVERFTVLDLPPAATPGMTGALWQSLPPTLPPQPEWLDHPNGVRRLVGATVIVPDTTSLQESYERLFGPANVHTTDKVISVRSGRQRLLIATRDDFAAMHPEVEPDDSAGDSFIALVTLGVDDLNKAADYLVNWQIEHEAPGTGRLVVPPSEASGVILEFIAERR